MIKNLTHNVVSQGAEAVIFHEGNDIIKERLSKSYRIKELDIKIRKQRTKAEKKLLEKASKIINAPNPFPLEEDTKIRMPFIEGKKLSESLNSLPISKQKEICREAGKEIAKLHENNIVHGDLTTSNMILTDNSEIYFIDFGLGFISPKAEDKAVDLHLLKQALEAKHFENWEVLFSEVLSSYRDYKDSEKIIERLKAVEKRGRYKGE